MNKIIPQICLSVLLLSALIYAIGRWVVRSPMSDDTADWFLWSGGISAAVLLFLITKGAPLSIRNGINAGSASVIIFLAAFGAWGLLSRAGRNQFPEMAGLFPYYALLLAGLLLVVLVIINLVWRGRLGRKAGA